MDTKRISRGKVSGDKKRSNLPIRNPDDVSQEILKRNNTETQRWGKGPYILKKVDPTTKTKRPDKRISKGSVTPTLHLKDLETYRPFVKRTRVLIDYLIDPCLYV